MRIFACLLLAAAVPAQSPTIGLWKFDESRGLVASDIGPFRNNGALVNFTNDPAQWVPGKFGNALRFDGVDDHVDVAFNGGLPFFRNDGAAFSIAFWSNGAPTDDDRLLTLGSSTSNTPLFTLGTGASSRAQNDRLRLYVRSDNNISLERVSAATVFDNTWHHVAYVEHAGEARVYVDGALDTAYFSYDVGLEPFTFDKLGLGGVLRGSPCCFLACAIDGCRSTVFR